MKQKTVLVAVPFDTKKLLSCTIKQFPTLNKESLESLFLIPEQTLQYGALDLIKDSISKLWQVRLESF